MAEPPPAQRADASGAVDVWSILLPREPPRTASLSADERARAGRFVRELHRARFIGCRHAMRCILASYRGCQPGDLEIVSDAANGKPSLAAGDGLEFNLAHCDDRALLAVASQPVGVDLELTERRIDPQTVAARFFSPRERDMVEGASDQAGARRAFLRIWAAKEATLKLIGIGLRADLAAFDAGDAAAADSLQVVVPGLHAEPVHLTALPHPAGHAFLATFAPPGDVALREWPPDQPSGGD